MRLPMRVKPIYVALLAGAVAGSLSLMLTLTLRRRTPRLGAAVIPVYTDVDDVLAPPHPPSLSPTQVGRRGEKSLSPPQVREGLGVKGYERASVEAHRMIAAACTMIALVLLVVSALLFQPGVDGDARVPAAAVVMLIGVAMVGVALRFAHLPPLPIPPRKAVTFPPVRRWAVWGGALVLFTLGEISANKLGIPVLQAVSQHVQFTLLVIGAGLVTWGLSGRPRRATREDRSMAGEDSSESSYPGRTMQASSLRDTGFVGTTPALSVSINNSIKKINLELLLVLAILAMALVLRAGQLGTLIHFPVDEMHMIEAVNDLRQNPNTPLMLPFNQFATYSWMFPYTQNIGSLLFGSTFTGLRAPSVLLGVLAVLGVYLLGRWLFNRPVAIIAALLLMVYPPHLHFSRIGLTLITDIPFGGLMFAFAARALFARREHVRADYALAGMFIGIATYCSEGGRILYMVLMICWIVALAVTNPRHIWQHRVGIATMALTALLIAFPLYYAWFTHGYSFTPRLDQFTVWQKVPENFAELYDLRLKAPLMHFLHEPDTGSFYSGQTPLITVFVAPFFMFGLGYLLWRGIPARRKVVSPGALLLLGWIAGTIAGTSMLQSNGWTPRFVVAAPGIVLLAAVAITEGAKLLIPLGFGDAERGRMRIRTALAGVVTAALVVAQANYYFNVHVPYFNNRAGFDISFRPYRDFYDVAFRAALLPPNTAVFLVTSEEVRIQDFKELRDYWDNAHDIIVTLPDMLTPDVIFALPDDKNYAFFVEPDDQRLMMFLRGRFPSLSNVEFSPFNVPTNAQFILYYAPLEQHPES